MGKKISPILFRAGVTSLWSLGTFPLSGQKYKLRVWLYNAIVQFFLKQRAYILAIRTIYQYNFLFVQIIVLKLRNYHRDLLWYTKRRKNKFYKWRRKLFGKIYPSKLKKKITLLKHERPDKSAIIPIMSANSINVIKRLKLKKIYKKFKRYRAKRQYKFYRRLFMFLRKKRYTKKQKFQLKIKKKWYYLLKWVPKKYKKLKESQPKFIIQQYFFLTKWKTKKNKFNQLFSINQNILAPNKLYFSKIPIPKNE